MWMLFGSILSQIMRGPVACVEIGLQGSGCCALVSSNRTCCENRIACFAGRMRTLSANWPLRMKTGIWDLFVSCMLRFVTKRSAPSANQGSPPLSGDLPNVGTVSKDRWFLSPRIRGQSNESRNDSADPDFTYGRVRIDGRFFQSDRKQTQSQTARRSR